ncbi:hypothetical protein M0805_009549 [Coniferiporia weirii]|nr:hypothetical protein M0805_009549 [Coniferiporia weirii]
MVTDIVRSGRYADRARMLMRAAQKLRDIGKADIDIPRIAVIGGQSAGKSSLVEAVSGIRVPRDGGTCTRCPMEVNLISASGVWSCRITLRLEFDHAGNRLTEVLCIPFGSPLTSRDDVELTLRRAQAAILNHHRESADTFLLKSRDDLEYYRTPGAFKNGTLKFSKNAVVVDIFDDDCANLSFVDLPGLIQNDEQQTVELVENLVRANITGHCLILVTIPMSDDMENQRAMRIALEMDADRERTIGVLTKPDTLTVGALSARRKWRDLLIGNERSNGTHALKLGYYCVKLADDAERANNPSSSERNASESSFFSTTSPWDVVRNRSHFGVLNLVNDLSRHLTGLLDSILPKLREQAERELDACLKALSELPEVPKADPSSEVLGHVTEFCQELTAIVFASGSALYATQLSDPDVDGKAFVRLNRIRYNTFKRDIRRTCPDFRPFEHHEDYTTPRYSCDIDRIDSDSEKDSEPHDLLYVQDVIRKSIGWELPNNVPFEAKCVLITEFINKWEKPVLQCFEDVSTSLALCLDTITQKHFGRFPKLKSHMELLIKDLLHGQKSFARAATLSTLKREKYPLFTQNEDYLSSLRALWVFEYKEVLRRQDNYLKSKQPVEEYEGLTMGIMMDDSPSQPRLSRAFTSPTESASTRALKALGELGYTGLSVKDFARLRPSTLDTFHDELEVMADVTAYFFVTYKRIIDEIPLTIEHALNQGLVECIQKSLLKKLLGAPDSTRRLAELLEEDPDMADRRQKLTAKIERLEKIQAELRTLPG